MRRSADGRPGLPSRVDAVLLDAGGVLLDLDYAYLRRLLQARRLSVDEVALSRAEADSRMRVARRVQDGESVGELWREYFHTLLGRVGLPSSDHDEVIDSLWEAHQRVGLWTLAIPGAVDAVALLAREGYRLGVVSNAEGRVERDLEKAGYRGTFEIVVDSHVVGVEKPDPAIFRIALERMKLAAERTIFVGDLPAVDIDGARAAGIEPVLVDRHDLYPDVDVPRVRSIDELPALLAAARTA